MPTSSKPLAVLNVPGASPFLPSLGAFRSGRDAMEPPAPQRIDVTIRPFGGRERKDCRMLGWASMFLLSR